MVETPDSPPGPGTPCTAAGLSAACSPAPAAATGLLLRDQNKVHGYVVANGTEEIFLTG